MAIFCAILIIFCVGLISYQDEYSYRSMIGDLKRILKKFSRMIQLPGKMSNKRFREGDNSGETPAATRLRISDISAIPGQGRGSHRLAQLRQSGNDSNPLNMGPTVTLAPISESYHDSTAIHDMSIDLRDVEVDTNTGGSDQVPGGSGVSGNARQSNVTPGTGGAGLQQVTVNQENLDYAGQGGGGSGVEKICAVEEEDPWLLKYMKNSLNLFSPTQINLDGSSGFIFNFGQMHGQYFDRNFIQETIGIAQSLEIVVPAQLVPGPTVAWYGLIENILMKYKVSDAEKAQIVDLAKDELVKPIFISLGGLVEAMRGDDVELLRVASEIIELSAYKLLTISTLNTIQLVSEFGRALPSAKQKWLMARNTTLEMRTKLVATGPVTNMDRSGLRALNTQLNNYFREAQLAFDSLVHKKFKKPGDPGYVNRIMLFLKMNGVEVKNLAEDDNLERILIEWIENICFVAYFSAEEKCSNTLKQFRDLAEVMREIAEVDVQQVVSDGEHSVIDTNLDRFFLRPQGSSRFPSTVSRNNDTRDSDNENINEAIEDSAKSIIEDVKKFEKLVKKDTKTRAEYEKMTTEELNEAKTLMKLYETKILEIWSKNTRVKKKDLKNFPVETQQAIIGSDGHPEVVTMVVTLDDFILELEKLVSLQVTKVEKECKRKEENEKETRERIKKILPETEITKATQGEDHLLLVTLDDYWSKYYIQSERRFVNQGVDNICRDMCQRVTPNLRILLTTCRDLKELHGTFVDFLTRQNHYMTCLISYLKRKRKERETKKGNSPLSENMTAVAFYTDSLRFLALVLKYQQFLKKCITLDVMYDLENCCILPEDRKSYHEKLFSMLSMEPEERDCYIRAIRTNNLSQLSLMETSFGSLSASNVTQRSFAAERDLSSYMTSAEDVGISSFTPTTVEMPPFDRLVFLVYRVDITMRMAQAEGANLKRNHREGPQMTRGGASVRVNNTEMIEASFGPDEATDDLEMEIGVNAMQRRPRRLMGNNSSRPSGPLPPPTPTPLNPAIIQDGKFIYENNRFIVVRKCPLVECGQLHKLGSLWHCPIFAKMSSQQKAAAVKRSNTCARCITCHDGNMCQSTSTCRRCGKADHHQLLCPASQHTVNNLNMMETVAMGEDVLGQEVQDSINIANFNKMDMSAGNLKEHDRTTQLIMEYQVKIRNTPVPHNITSKHDNDQLITYTTDAGGAQSGGESEARDTGGDISVNAVSQVSCNTFLSELSLLPAAGEQSGQSEHGMVTSTLSSNLQNLKLCTENTVNSSQDLQQNLKLCTEDTVNNGQDLLGANASMVRPAAGVVSSLQLKGGGSLAKSRKFLSGESTVQANSFAAQDSEYVNTVQSNVSPNMPCCNKRDNTIFLTSENKDYGKYLELSNTIADKHSKSYLHYIWLRVVLGHQSTFHHFEKLFQHLSSVTVGIYRGYCVVYVRTLLDQGAERTCVMAELRQHLTSTFIRTQQYTLCTPSGRTPVSDTVLTINIMADSGEMFETETLTLHQLSPQSGWSDNLISIMAADLGMSDYELISRIDVPNYFVQPMILLGNESKWSTSYNIHDMRRAYMPQNPVFNPNIHLTWCPVAAGKQFILSGSFGVSRSVSNNIKPTFCLDANLSQNDIRVIARKIVFYLGRLELNDDNIYSNYNMCLHLSSVSGLCSEVQLNAAKPVMFTKADCFRLEQFIQAESSLLNPVQYCPTHQSVIDENTKNCEECMCVSNNIEVAGQTQLYEEICKHLSAVPKGDGTYTMMQRLVFLHDPKQIGHLSRHNLKDAYQSSVRLVKKLKKIGYLENIDSQLRERLKRGEMAILSDEEIEDLMSGKRPGAYVRRNITIKPSSSSTPVRALDDTSIVLKNMDTSLADSQRAPRTGVPNIIGMVLRMFMYQNLISSDVSRAYLMTKLTEEDSYLFLSIWFRDVLEHQEKYPIIMRALCQIFGMGSASTSLHACFDLFIKEALKLEKAREQLMNNKFVDNLNHYGDTPAEVVEILKDVVAAAKKFSFDVSKYFAPHWLCETPEMKAFLDSRNYVMPSSTTTLGIVWSLLSDEMAAAFQLNIHPTVKGLAHGPPLKDMTLTPDMANRRVMCRLTSQLYCVTGRFLGVIIANAKLLLHKICDVMPHDNLDMQVYHDHPQLAEEFVTFWTSVASGKLEPWPRCVLKTGERVVRFCATQDASNVMYGASVYVVVTHGDTVETHLISAKSHICDSTVPRNESRAILLSVTVLHEVMKELKCLIDSQPEPPDVVVCGDSMISTFLYRPGSECKGMLARNLRTRTTSYLSSIMTLFPRIKIHLVWSYSDSIAADLLSKQSSDCIQATNSKKYRFGHQLYSTEEILYYCYLFCHNLEFTYSQLPAFNKTKSHPNMKEIIASNPHVSARTKSEQKELGAEIGCHSASVMTRGESDHGWTLEDEDLYSEMSVFSGNLSLQELEVMWTYLEGEDTAVADDASCPLSDVEMELEEFRDTSHYSQMSAVLIAARCTNNLMAESVCNVSTAPVPALTPALFTRHMLRSTADTLVSTPGPMYHITRDNYGKIVNEKQNLLDTLNKLGRVFKAVNYFKSCLKSDKKEQLMDEKTLRSCVWKSLLLADQKYFQSEPMNCQTSTENGIKVVLSRKQNFKLPYISNKSPLFTRIVWTLHQENTNVFPFRSIHHPHKSILSWLSSINIGIYTENAEKRISETLKYCSTCSKINVLYYKSLYGSRIKFTSDDGLYSHTFLDPIGFFKIKAHSKARGPSVFCYGLFCVCISTGCCDMVIIESVAAKDIVKGIFYLQFKTNSVVRKITVDAGTSLSHGLLTENNRFSFVVEQLNPKHQSRSLAESRYRNYKQIYRKIMRQFKFNDNAYCLNMTAVELAFIFEMTTLTCNLLPYTKGNVLSPAYFRYSPQLIQNWTRDDLEGSKMFEKYVGVYQELQKVRKEIMNEITNFDVKYKYYHNKGRQDSRPAEEGDVVMYLSKPVASLAVIKEINTEHVCTIFTGNRTFKTPIKELILIQPNLKPDTTNDSYCINLEFIQEKHESMMECAEVVTGNFAIIEPKKGMKFLNTKCLIVNFHLHTYESGFVLVCVRLVSGHISFS